MSDSKPPVGTVQPTPRPPIDQLPSTSQESFATCTSSKSSQSTQFSTTPLKLPTDNKATSPLQSDSKSSPELPNIMRYTFNSITISIHVGPSLKCNIILFFIICYRSLSESGFPKVGMTPRLVEAPAFYPSEKEFSDPLEYLEKITPQAEHYGI